MCVYVYLSVCLSLHLCVFVYVVCVSVCLSIYVVYVYLCVSVYVVCVCLCVLYVVCVSQAVCILLPPLNFAFFMSLLSLTVKDLNKSSKNYHATS